MVHISENPTLFTQAWILRKTKFKKLFACYSKYLQDLIGIEKFQTEKYEYHTTCLAMEVHFVSVAKRVRVKKLHFLLENSLHT